MAKQTVNIGTSVNKGDGDPLRTAFTKINQNFTELYVQDVPATSAGKTGDVKGMLAVDTSYLYVCFKNYDGAGAIWKRIALASF
jgi:NAD(P)H-hydrate repair Nnr-like enzyme with NAD(P)H-hydrate epimerase domain